MKILGSNSKISLYGLLALIMMVTTSNNSYSQIKKTMYLIKLNGSKAELRQTNGNLVRYIGNNDVAYADINGSQDHVLITTTSGKVELRALNNNLVRYIGNGDALDARWNGTDILVRTKSGKLELRTMTNNLVRYL
jgi:hypothetical protein